MVSRRHSTKAIGLDRTRTAELLDDRLKVATPTPEFNPSRFWIRRSRRPVWICPKFSVGPLHVVKPEERLGMLGSSHLICHLGDRRWWLSGSRLLGTNSRPRSACCGKTTPARLHERSLERCFLCDRLRDAPRTRHEDLHRDQQKSACSAAGRTLGPVHRRHGLPAIDFVLGGPGRIVAEPRMPLRRIIGLERDGVVIVQRVIRGRRQVVQVAARDARGGGLAGFRLDRPAGIALGPDSSSS